MSYYRRRLIQPIVHPLYYPDLLERCCMKSAILRSPASALSLSLILCALTLAQQKPRIVVFSGPAATVLSSPPLITSNKARALRGLPLLTRPDGRPAPFDHLVPQRLAAPVEVLIEQFSAHPMARDAGALYGPPDGYVDRKRLFHPTRQNSDDKPVY